MFELFVKSKRYQHWFMIIPLIFSGMWFYLLEIKVTRPDYLLYNRLDDYIPFTPLFVIPYILWYAYVALPAFFFFWKAPQEFVKLAFFLAAGMIAACTIYTLFPNGQALRPVLASNEGLLSNLVKFIYSNDTPANSAPSIHTIYSVAAHGAITRYNNFRQRIMWVNNISFAIAVLCILSTVFIKQHSIIDLTAGLLLSGLLYLLVYNRKNIRTENNSNLWNYH